jgi:hypothetical protein
MHMHKKFSRWKGAGGTALGSDVVPGAPVYGVSAPVMVGGDELDNVLAHRFLDVNGWPAHRIAVAMNYKGIGTPVALPAQLYVYDSLTQRWFALGPVTNLEDGKISFFDTLGISQRAKSADAASLADMTAGGELVMLVVNDTNPAAAPAGEYEFAMAADLTTIGY